MVVAARPWRDARAIPVGGLQDYPEELNLVRRIQGPSTRFTRANYIQMVRARGGGHPHRGDCTEKCVLEGAGMTWRRKCRRTAPLAPPQCCLSPIFPKYAIGEGSESTVRGLLRWCWHAAVPLQTCASPAESATLSPALPPVPLSCGAR